MFSHNVICIEKPNPCLQLSVDVAELVVYVSAKVTPVILGVILGVLKLYGFS